MQWRSISMSRHSFTACNTKNLSRNLPVQLFISISCSIVSETLANRGIVWLSNGKGGGLPGDTEAPLPTHLLCKRLTKTVAVNLMSLALKMKNSPSLLVLMCVLISTKEHQACRYKLQAHQDGLQSLLEQDLSLKPRN